QSDVDVNYTNENGLSALDKAVICKDVAICKALINRGCKLDEKSGKFKRTPLHKAVDLGCFDIVKLLLDAGSSVDTTDYRGEYPIHSAAIRGHTEIVRTLLEKDRTLAVKPFSFRGKVYYKQLTLFHYAVLKEDEILLNLLKEFKIDSNIQDGYGRTPLYLATYYNKPKYVEHIIDKADVKIADRHGSTPLHAAAFKMIPELLKLLCRFYTDIRMVDRNGNTVFHVLKNSSENARSIKGNASFDICKNLSKCVKILLEKDAEFEYTLRRIKNKKGIIVSVECENDVYSLTYY
ncbi:serine/threonine-protein phosphatase 6 regulatory ankyrin repeat subunit C-like, partial [Mercenaria mercenaria]|uniref:serine/threonine-protein phosphatase 6 regulatory ankyrin repeat subunit C-like n=1 Tax=Mercenaria mercenaria TaxID=6596 RepID=UPI00234E7D8F